MDKPIPELLVSDLDTLYREADDCDKRIFAEMRTNLQLVAGEHYIREGSRFWNRIRTDKELTDQQKLKLTKNHIGRIMTAERNGISRYAPDVAIEPANEKELSDQKAAELHSSYLKYTKNKTHWEEKKALWLKNFVEIGEVAVKVFWNPEMGSVLGNEAAFGSDGKPMYDEMGEIVQSDTPYYGGCINYETIFGYNLRREPNSETMHESPYLIVSKMIPVSRLYTLTNDKAVIEKLKSESSTEYKIYDSNTGRYTSATGQVLIKEIYWRPANMIQNGYYQMWISGEILSKGELPGGVFPIITQTYETQSGNPRGYSKIRPLRPCQVEVNRCASKMAEHQVTLGDDKIIMQSGAKMTQGGILPGIRALQVTGIGPTILPGRTGEQYLPYAEAQINEMYQLAEMPELLQEQTGSQDLLTELYKSMRFKAKFSIHGERYERFLKEVVETTLKIAKYSANEQELIEIFGKSETLNVGEFKNARDIGYEIRVTNQSADIDSQMGKQIALTNLFQYVGSNLDKQDIGKLARLSPFLNKEQIFSDFTRNYDKATNDILALDRGIYRPARKYEDHQYMIDRISGRMAEPDFEFMQFDIQQMYQQALNEHEKFKAQSLEEERAAQAGFIPSGGYLVTCDFYTSDKEGKTKRLRIPSEALQWLIKRLESQGSEMIPLAESLPGVRQDLAHMIGDGQQHGQGDQSTDLLRSMVGG